MWVKIVLIAALVGGLAYLIFSWRASLIAEGEAKVTAKDAEVVAAKMIHNQKVEDRAKDLSSKQVEELKKQLEAPPAVDAPHLVCLRNNPAKTSSSTVHETSSSRSSAPSTTEQPTVVQEQDFGPDIDKRFADDDAMIKALQDRVRLDIETCGG